MTVSMVKRSVPLVPTTPAWACVDCMILLANGETDGNWTEAEKAEFLARFEAGTADCEVTLGMMAEYHECADDDGEMADECDCEEMTFSWSSCDICRSNLGGSRHAVTFWVKP